jgi:hypothetical protein
MKLQEFQRLGDEELIRACVEPIIRKARGKDPETKAKVVAGLNSGQRALFFFQVLYGHAGNGIPQFFEQISYLADQLDLWAALKSGIRYFDDTEMLELLEQMETAYHEAAKQSETTIAPNELDRLYQQRIPFTLRKIGSFIRSHPEEFIQLEN